MQKVYIVISKTPGKLGFIIRKAIRHSYNHVSLSLDKDLTEMHTFARLRKSNFLIGGYREETAESLALGTEKSVLINLYEIPLTETEYNEIIGYISSIKNDNETYYYNFFIKMSLYKTMTCLSFVTNCLKYINNLMPVKKISKFQDLEKVIDKYKVFEGEITAYPYIKERSLNTYYYTRYIFIKEVYKAVRHCIYILKRHFKSKRKMI